MADNIDKLNEDNKKGVNKIKVREDEIRSLRQQACTLKSYNTVLKQTIKQLKSETLLEKYRDEGKHQAEKEMLDLL